MVFGCVIEFILHSRTTMQKYNGKNNEIHKSRLTYILLCEETVYHCYLMVILRLLFFHEGNGMQFTIINNNNNDKINNNNIYTQICILKTIYSN